MALVVLLLILAVIFGGVGLLVTGLKWMLIVAVIFLLASALSGFLSHS